MRSRPKPLAQASGSRSGWYRVLFVLGLCVVGGCALPGLDRQHEADPSAPPAATATKVDPERARCDLGDAVSRLAQLESLPPDDFKRDHQAAIHAYQADPNENNRVQLIQLMAVAKTPLRDDVRALRLLEATESSAIVVDCHGQLANLLLRVTATRWRWLRDEQRRHELQLRDEQRNHELMVREESRRFDALLREIRQKNESLERKLDALIEIDRRIRRELNAPRR